MDQPKATQQTLKVLEAFLERPLEARHGFDLLGPTGLRSGTLYPILIRLQRLGWLASHWEEGERRGPRRRLYLLTAEGEPAARKLVAERAGGQRFMNPAGAPRTAPAGGSV
jgi:PadR family transcriptional regulator, regulatory protein PadR